MQLSQYLDGGHDTQSGLANRLGVSRQRVAYWVKHLRRLDPEMALAIEKATKGRVTAEEAIGLGRRHPIRVRK
jgi:DNA-binding transcriptional regulator YdaS (Cro superfamily)